MMLSIVETTMSQHLLQEKQSRVDHSGALGKIYLLGIFALSEHRMSWFRVNILYIHVFARPLAKWRAGSHP